MEKEENEKMKALARYGKEFGGYRMIDVPKPTCGPEDIIIEIKAAAICGADMKHYKVDNGSDEFNSIRGHELQIGSSTAASSYFTFSGISQIACLWILRISPGTLQYLENPPPHVLLSRPKFTLLSQQRKSPCSQAGQTPHT